MIINQSAMPAVAPSVEEAQFVARSYSLVGLEQHNNGCWYAYQKESGKQVRITTQSVAACIAYRSFYSSLLSVSA